MLQHVIFANETTLEWVVLLLKLFLAFVTPDGYRDCQEKVNQKIL
jgi:hypothetical protein